MENCDATMTRIRLSYCIDDSEIGRCSQTQTDVSTGMMPRLCQDENIKTLVIDQLMDRRWLVHSLRAGQRLNVEPSNM
jgi:hypothetical protein